MATKKNECKIILECNNFGIVNQVFLDTGKLLESIKLPVGLHSLVSPLSIKELGGFWLSILENSMEENTVLTLSYNDKQVDFIFSGYLLKNKVLLCGSTELKAAVKALEEIMLINNEQANHIRLTEKKLGNLLANAEKQELDEAFLNDFTSLNNELINNKRELMRKNQKIELLNEELSQVNQNMSLFTYSVSHDLKEPVRMVKQFLSLFNKKYGESLDQKGKTYIEMALDGANRLSNMLMDLLEYHRTSDLNITEAVNLDEVYNEVMQLLDSEIATKNAQITTEKLPTVIGAFAAYLQIFQNILSNAVKFVGEGQTPVVDIQVEENETTYTLKVKDNGIGIPENQKDIVFELFKRLHSSQQYEGTGMGLAIVRKSIERMGGEVWFRSEEGKGSTFYFTIKKGTSS